MEFNIEELLRYAEKSSIDHITSHDILEFIPYFYKISSYLEIGIGRGGSVKHVLRHFKGQEITCVDLAPWNYDTLKHQLYNDKDICLLTEFPEYNMSHCGRKYFEMEKDLKNIKFLCITEPFSLFF